MVAFLIATVIVGLLIICGVLVNLYLYSQGALRTRRFAHGSPYDTMTQEQYEVTIGSTEDIMGMYVRRGIAVFLGAIVLLCLVVVFIFTALPG